MEPTNLNSPRDEDTALAALLRASAPAIPDDGFTARVMSALPPAPSPRTTSARWPWLAGVAGGLAGAAVVAFQAATWSDFVSGTGALLQSLSIVVTACADPWLVLAATLCAFSLAMALAFIRPRWRFW